MEMNDSPILIDEYHSIEIRRILADRQIFTYFKNQVESLNRNYFELTIRYEKIFIIFHINQYYQAQTAKDQEEFELLKNKKSVDIECRYAIKVSKSYPVKGSLKIHLLDGGFQPKISDCRDFFEEIMGKTYDHHIHFKDIVIPLLEFDKKIHEKNEKYLQMQQLGKFTLGETYKYKQLTETYTAITLLKDFSDKKHSIYVGITETNILIFRELKPTQKNHPTRHHNTVSVKSEKQLLQNEQTANSLLLINSGEMQCIDSILYYQPEKLINITFKKYNSIKLYNEAEEIKRYYVFNKAEIFLRNILKFIAKFQKCEIDLIPGTHLLSQKDKKGKEVQLETVAIAEKIEECSRYEDQINRELDQSAKKKKIELLNRVYQRLIEYFSARTNPYYLIYVNKINNLYIKHFINSSKKQQKAVL